MVGFHDRRGSWVGSQRGAGGRGGGRGRGRTANWINEEFI